MLAPVTAEPFSGLWEYPPTATASKDLLQKFRMRLSSQVQAPNLRGCHGWGRVNDSLQWVGMLGFAEEPIRLELLPYLIISHTPSLPPTGTTFTRSWLPFPAGKKLCLSINWRIQDMSLHEQGTWHCKWYQADLYGQLETLLSARIRAQICLTVHIHCSPLHLLPGS